MVEAITIAHWREPLGDDASVDRVLTSGPKGRDYGAGSGYAEVVFLAAERVAPGDEQAARKVLEASGRVASGLAYGIRAALVRRGHGSLVVAMERERWFKVFDPIRWKASSDASQRGWLAFLQVLITGKPEHLSKLEARRLDELADFTTSIGFMNMPYHWSFDLADRLPALRHIADVATRLGQFNRGKLAAEAAVVMELEPDEGELLLGIGGLARGLTNWNAVADIPHALDVLCNAMGEGPFFTATALDCLEHYPGRPEILLRLRLLLPRVDGESKELVGRALVAWDPAWRSLARAWLGDSEPVLQEVAARAFGREARDGGSVTDDLRSCLRSSSLLIRSYALRQLGEPSDSPPTVLEAVSFAAASAPTQWSCPRCETLNEAAQSYCSDCRVVSNDWAKWTAALANQRR